MKTQSPFASLVHISLIVFVSLFFVACDRGVYKTPVDGSVPTQYDTTARSMVDDGSTMPGNQGTQAPPQIILRGADGFIVPPNGTASGPASASDTSRFATRDAVQFTMWNSRGGSQLFLGEGEKASIPAVGHVVDVNAIGSKDGGRVFFLVDEKQIPILHVGEEVHVGDSYVYVSQILLNNPNELP